MRSKVLSVCVHNKQAMLALNAIQPLSSHLMASSASSSSSHSDTVGSVVGASTHGIDGAWVTYDNARVDKRAEMIGYGISARSRGRPDEVPYRYRPHAEAGARFAWDDGSRAAIRDYQKLDLFI